MLYEDLPRGYKVPLDGYLLFIFFLPCALLAAFVASQTEKASLLVAGMLAVYDWTWLAQYTQFLNGLIELPSSCLYKNCMVHCMAK